MGSRGAFIDVDTGNFDFVENGQHYMSVGVLSSNPNVKILVQDSNAVKAPEFSQTPGRVYAIVKDGQLKHLTYYGRNHNQSVSIDCDHTHKGIRPHRHIHLNHDKNEPGVPPSIEELELIRRIKKEYHLK